jgi:hypothetical protein
VLIVGREINDSRKQRADKHTQKLVPIKERNADPIRLDLVVEGGPNDNDELDRKEQVPPAPSTPLLLRIIHDNELPDTMSGDVPGDHFPGLSELNELGRAYGALQTECYFNAGICTTDFVAG